jgi:hypothetical protein
VPSSRTKLPAKTTRSPTRHSRPSRVCLMTSTSSKGTGVSGIAGCGRIDVLLMAPSLWRIATSRDVPAARMVSPGTG